MGTIRCELFAGEEVVYSKDVGSPRPFLNPSGQPSSSSQGSSQDASQEMLQEAFEEASQDVVKDESREELNISMEESEALAVASSIIDDAAGSIENEDDSNNAVCVRLCSLIKAQLVKAHAEVTRRYGGQQLPMTLSDAANSVSPGSIPGEEGEAVTPVAPCTPTSPGTYHIFFPFVN